MTPRPDDHVRPLAGAFVLGHLDPAEATAVRAHLEAVRPAVTRPEPSRPWPTCCRSSIPNASARRPSRGLRRHCSTRCSSHRARATRRVAARRRSSGAWVRGRGGARRSWSSSRCSAAPGDPTRLGEVVAITASSQASRARRWSTRIRPHLGRAQHVRAPDGRPTRVWLEETGTGDGHRWARSPGSKATCTSASTRRCPATGRPRSASAARRLHRDGRCDPAGVVRRGPCRAPACVGPGSRPRCRLLRRCSGARPLRSLSRRRRLRVPRARVALTFPGVV